MFDDNLIEFLQDKKPNINKLYIHDIWNYTNEQLENIHNYIQWIFPIDERSFFNIVAPILTYKKIETIKNSQLIKDNILKSYNMMLSFYDFDHVNQNTKWLTPGNHNYLRMTRIMKCLKLVGLEKESEEFHCELKKLYNMYPDIIGTKTASYWHCN